MASSLVVGRMVHVKVHDQSNKPVCTAAFVSRVVKRNEEDNDTGTVHLTVLKSTGPEVMQNVPHGKSEEEGSWHWPVRVDKE